MTYARKLLAGLIPVLLTMSMPASAQQAQSPLAQALSAATATTVTSTTQAVTNKIDSAVDKALLPPSKSAAPVVPGAPPAALPASSSGPKQPPAPQPPAVAANKPKPRALNYKARRTLFVEVGQEKLRLEAPEKMCFVDRTASPMQEKIYIKVSALAEKLRDQVLMAVFMNCNGFTSPDDWTNGMPDAGFFTWMNPAIGPVTTMSRQDYLDMREVSFPQYVKNRETDSRLDKAVHRNGDNVSLGLTRGGQKGDMEDRSTTVLSTTTVRNVPIEATLHYAGDMPPSTKEVYPIMDKLMEQQIALNE